MSSVLSSAFPLADRVPSTNPLDIHIVANATLGPYMSGGDRIFVECARNWALQNAVKVYVWEEGLALCKRNDLSGVCYIIWSAIRYKKFGFAFNYLMRTIIGIREAFGVASGAPGETPIIYSASDFWPDSLPAFFMRWKLTGAKWVAGFYLFAPKPWQKDSPYKGRTLIVGLCYWLMQIPIYWLVKRYADMVFVTSEPDVKKFVTRKRTRDKILVIKGGVDIGPSKKYFEAGAVLPLYERKYDACFVGRFHHQKGIFELIDIWKLVRAAKTNARLAMIGGPLSDRITEKIQLLALEDAIDLLGFRDGEEKYEVFRQSKLVVHPATYDSGGMAACEAMAWGLPGVSFDLEALRTYYPKGMLKTPCFDVTAFATNILKLIEDPDLYEKTSMDAIAWAREWDWERNAEEILKKMTLDSHA